MEYVHITPGFKLSLVTWIFITVQLHCMLQSMIEGRSVVNTMFTICQVPLVTVVLTFFSTR